MRRILVTLAIIAFCFVMVTPVFAGFDTLPDHYITRSYNYVLDGRQGTISLALSTEIYQDYVGKDPLWDTSDTQAYFLNFVNDPAQKPAIRTLAEEIRGLDDNPDNQARIAANLVQHIPYDTGEKYRYPYEVLYEGRGVCGEKSMLLASLLGELGFKSAVLYFQPLNHMTAGIACDAPYNFKGSDYCMIETTGVSIITDESSMRNETTVTVLGENEWSRPNVTVISEGRSLESAQFDYYDSRLWIHMKSENTKVREGDPRLSQKEYEQFYRLKNKYDLS